MLDPMSFEATLWRWNARRDEWFFVTVPIEAAREIAAIPLPPRGFGSVKVVVTIGSTTWQTSVFPDDDQTYSLPIKKSVRAAEGIEEHQVVEVTLQVVGFRA